MFNHKMDSYVHACLKNNNRQMKFNYLAMDFAHQLLYDLVLLTCLYFPWAAER